MKWFVHIGTEKTGSSHLQSIMSLGRESLAAKGFAFPAGTAHDESCMQSGQISAGNGRRLAASLGSHDLAAARAEISNMAGLAKRAGRDRVIVATEWLLPVLAVKGGLSRFLGLLREQGSDAVSLLLVLRDPVDQCLSLYKHRAKSGKLSDIGDWLDKGYRLPSELTGLHEQLASCEVDLRVRRYSREPGALEKLFFEDWLGVRVPLVDLPATVNASLSLSELALIHQLALSRPELVQPMFDALARLPATDKARHAGLEDYVRAMAAAAVSAYAEEWAAWNDRLPANERLSIPERPMTLPPRPREVAFSQGQLATIAAVTAQAATLRALSRSFWHWRLRPALRRIARRFRSSRSRQSVKSYENSR